MKNFFFVSVFLATFFFGFANPANNDFTSCPAPTNVTKVDQTSNSISFEWDDCGCVATEYRVYYVKNGQTSPEFATTDPNISIGGLSAGNYQFYFYTVCGSGNSFIIVEEVIY